MSLRRRQELLLDAIEHSFAMAEIAYNRITSCCRSDGHEASPDLCDAMVLDAWSFIDVAKRLRSVLEHTPGLKHGAVLAEFLRVTEGVVDFRHHVQHMEDRATDLAPSGRPIWGSFSWVVFEPDGMHFRIVVYVPGRLAATQGVPAVNPAGKEFRSDVDHFLVTVGQTTLRISDLYYHLKSFQRRFRSALTVAQPRVIRGGAEIVVVDLDAPASAV